MIGIPRRTPGVLTLLVSVSLLLPMRPMAEEIIIDVSTKGAVTVV